MLLLGAHAGSAQKAQPLEPEWLGQMYQEGWHLVREGVLQRDAGEGAFETLSYGAEGLRSVVQGYEQRVRDFERKYNRTPDQKLGEVISQLKREIARLNREIQNAPSAKTFTQESLQQCSNSS
jgi:predicted  nucleic acid-binding Zn-ribbon protein